MPLHVRSAWTRSLMRLAALFTAAVGIGAVLGQVWMTLALAALAVVAWHYWRLHGLLARLTSRRRTPPRPGVGLWQQVDRLLYGRQQDMRARKRRLVGMLRAYRAVAAALPDAVVVVERNTQRIQWFNSAATSLLGLRLARDVGMPVGTALQPLPIAHWFAHGRRAEPMLDMASPVSPGTRLELRLTPYSEDLWLLVARDVTKLVRLEQMRRDFVANVSHELRTPLTVVHGYLDMLDPAEQPEWAPMLQEMQHQSQRMTQLVEDLLTLSRLEAQDSLGEETVSMASMLATLRRELTVLGKGRHTITVEDASATDLMGSPRELHSAFSNLVGNAVRYTPAGGRITVRYQDTPEGGVSLAVEDTGYGIPAAHLPRITERFYRVSTSRSRESGGTGLGLAIVKHVLHLHQARLEIDSEVGRGSRFACIFTAARVRPRETARSGAIR